MIETSQISPIRFQQFVVSKTLVLSKTTPGVSFQLKPFFFCNTNLQCYSSIHSEPAVFYKFPSRSGSDHTEGMLRRTQCAFFLYFGKLPRTQTFLQNSLVPRLLCRTTSLQNFLVPRLLCGTSSLQNFLLPRLLGRTSSLQNFLVPRLLCRTSSLQNFLVAELPCTQTSLQNC